MADSALPAHLALVIDFVNTHEPEDHSEALGDGAALSTWLHDHRLLDAQEQANDADAFVARDLREALRDVLTDGDSGRIERAESRLDELTVRWPLTLSFTTDPPHLVPAGTGVAGALAGVISALALAAADGTWSRLKICGADDCRWAFYDTSRNHSRTWCSMDVCGNRTKTRAYRARHGASRR